MGLLSGCLVGSSPDRPCDDVGGRDLSLSEPDGDAADFLDRPSDQGGWNELLARCLVFGGGAALA